MLPASGGNLSGGCNSAGSTSYDLISSGILLELNFFKVHFIGWSPSVEGGGCGGGHLLFRGIPAEAGLVTNSLPCRDIILRRTYVMGLTQKGVSCVIHVFSLYVSYEEKELQLLKRPKMAPLHGILDILTKSGILTIE